MKKLILFILTLIILINVIGNYKEDYYIIPDKSIRIRIIPNSNNITDQYLKKQVKTNLEIELEEDLKNSNTIENSRRIINKNLNNYQNTIKKVLENEKTNQNFEIDYGYHYFPEKIYKGVKYKEGEYESLLVTLGKGKGDNWWCILFPPLCSLEVEENNNENIEYSLYVKEMFEKYIK
ncbi:MAG: stage II sporulation protein R [Bacilli bacterium]